MIAVDAAGYQIAESDESTPTMKPVSTEPAIDPMPPATTTAKVSAIISCPMKGEMLRIGAARAPATPASPAAQKKVPEMSSGTLPPKHLRRSGRSVAARTSAPKRVRSSTNQATRHSSTETRRTKRRYFG